MSNDTETIQKDELVKPAQRLQLLKLAAEQYQAMFALSAAVAEAGLEPGLTHLVEMRASQLNGCGYCLDMHSKDAEALGESPQRLYALSAWRETPFFTARERAALALAEAATLIASHGPVEDEVWDEAAAHFSEQELAALLWVIASINLWNTLNVANRTRVGGYRAKQPQA